MNGGTAENPLLVYDNVIHVQQLANNQEYEGTPGGGTYAIQLEGTSYAQIYSNGVYAYGTGARLMPSASAPTILVFPSPSECRFTITS